MRTFRGRSSCFTESADFPFEGVSEAFPGERPLTAPLRESLRDSSVNGNRNLHCPRVSHSDSGAAPAIEVSKKRETLLPGSRNARPRPKHCKNRHFGRFWPETLGPPTPGRKRAPGLIRRSAKRPRLGRPAGIRFSGVSGSPLLLTV